MTNIRRTMAATAALAIALISASASAQPGSPPPPPPPGGGGYYPPPPPPPMWERRGLAIGFGLGLGGMSDSSGPINCTSCEVDPASVGLDFHVGAMLHPNLALLFEVWGQGQQLDAGGTQTLVQTMAMVAAQYWVTHQLWLKGGVGVSNLSVSIDDGYQDPASEQIDNGGAVMGAVGYEVLSSPRFAIDLQGRLGVGTYDGIDEQIETGMIALGFNWY